MEHTAHEDTCLQQMWEIAPHLIKAVQMAPRPADLASLSETLRSRFPLETMEIGFQVAVRDRYQELTQRKHPHGPR